MFKILSLDKTYQYLLIILSFLIPLTVFGANLIIVIICLLWVFSGGYKTKFYTIINSRLMLASIVFFCIHVIGLLWTEDLSWGFHTVHKMWYFIGLYPILYTLVKKEYISLYISAFLLAITLTEIISYLVWFELIEPFKYATVSNPTPFMSHISYNPILAFAIYLVLHELFFNKKITNLMFSLYSFFALSMSINMFITGGRAGQVAFFFMLAILIFQLLEKQRIRAFLSILIIIPSIFISAYQFSPLFKHRVNSAISDISEFSETNGYEKINHSHTSVGARIVFTMNSWQIIKKNLAFGVGTGDFPNDYKKISQANTPGMPYTSNPHNMYTLVAVELGLVGLISMMSIFYYQVKFSFNSPTKFLRDTGFTLPLLFLLLMWSDSYLLGHYTTLMFVFFSSFLYKDFEKYK